MRLNPGQQQAVEFVTGPCLVLAGAGSGKTRVITNKIAHLIRGCGYQARHIAAVTFTNKAAREMKERVGQTLGRKEARGLMISTFHTLGLDIIKREYAALGMKANFSLFDDTDQLALLKELTEGLIEDDKVLLQQLISTISNWKNDLKTPSQAAASAIGERDRIFAHCYGLYDAHLKACNVLDFDDLILLPTLLLQRNEEVRKRWQNKIRYLLVDEYQDTNTSQYELVKLLVGSRARFTVVGDDDQSIYSWRGARPQNLVLLSQDFPALKVIKLEQNYRSSGRILKAANILIANNPHVFEKRLFSELGYGAELKVLSANNEEHEAERVTGELIAHHFVNKTQYKDYAILYRGNHQSRVFEKFLMQNRIPYKISGGTSFFSRPEIKDLLAYLRVLTNPDDDSAFLRIVNTPKREIGPATLKKLGEWAMTRNKSMFTASFDMGLSQTLSGRGYEALTRFTHWLAEIQRLAGGALREGLVYGMLHLAVEQDIRSRTLRNIQRRFMIDIDQAQRVAKVAANFFDQVENEWHLEAISRDLLISACQLHEIGLSVDFKQAPQHAAYLVRNLDLPGFTPAQKKLLATLLLNQTNPVDLSSLHQQNAVPPRVAEQLCRLLRLAIIFASRRRDDLVPEMTLQANHELLTLTLPQGWLTQHPLGKEIIAQESQWQSYVHWPLEVH